jgi:hypothetical protein
MAATANIPPLCIDPLAKERDHTARQKFYQELDALLATPAGDKEDLYRKLAASMSELNRTFNAAPQRDTDEENAAMEMLQRLTDIEDAWLKCSPSTPQLLGLQMRLLIAEAQEGSCIEPWQLASVYRAFQRIHAEPLALSATGPAPEALIDPMAAWHPTPENVAQLPSCVRKRAKRNKRASADVAHVLARRDWLWRWQAAARDLELLEKAAARTEEEHLQATRAGDHTSAEILGTMWDALHRAQEELLQIPAPDLAGLERKIAIVKRREEEEAPVSVGILISIMSGDGVRLARRA